MGSWVVAGFRELFERRASEASVRSGDPFDAAIDAIEGRCFPGDGRGALDDMLSQREISMQGRRFAIVAQGDCSGHSDRPNRQPGGFRMPAAGHGGCCGNRMRSRSRRASTAKAGPGLSAAGMLAIPFLRMKPRA